VTAAQTEYDLVRALKEVVQLLEFDHFLYFSQFAVDKHDNLMRVITNYPDRWQEKYNASAYSQIDPIIQYSHSHLTPVIWSQLTHTSPEQRQYVEEMRFHGIGEGVSFPVHTRNGDIGVLSLANKLDRADTVELIVASLAEGMLIATYLHETMRRIVQKVRAALHAPLTKRELECLRWVAHGKSSGEISVILGISEHGVVHHMRNCMSKFGVHSRHLAVARATACGLL
jgi:LuxR family quorum-sensing transcriptional regulator LasR